METLHPELLFWLVLILVVLIIPNPFRSRRPRRDDTFQTDRWFWQDQQNWREWEEHHDDHHH